MNIDKKNTDNKLESTRGYSYGTPLCDIYENDNEYTILFELPGIEKEDIRINVEKEILTVTAESSKKPDEKYNCIREEMGFIGYKRSFNLNKIIDNEKINAELNNGILKLTLPKREEQKTKEISIKIA
jgi:HSP20 family protein